MFGILFPMIACSTETALDPDIDFNGKDGKSFAVTMERGAITDDGYGDASLNSYQNWVRTAFFVKTNGASAITFNDSKYSTYDVFQYDKDYLLLSSKRVNSKMLLDSLCTYIRFQIQTYSLPNKIDVRFYDADDNVKENKLVQQRFPFERLIYQVDGEICSTALLMLPPNYSVDGEKVPLILWDSGDGSFRDWDKYQGGSYEGRINGLCYLRDQGFAVLEIYSWGSDYYQKYPGCGSRSAMPIPIHLATHEKGVEYLSSRYNIDVENIFEVSKSGSGKISLYWAMFRPSFNLKAIYAFAPVFDDLNFVGWGMEGYRKALFEELDLQGTKEEVDFYLEGAPYDYDVEYKAEHGLSVNLKKSWQMHKPLGQSFVKKNAEKFKYVSVDWLGVEGISLEECISCTHTFSEMFWEGYNRHYNPNKNSFYFSWDNRALPATRKNTYTRHHLIRHGDGIPLTVIMSPTDEQTPYWNALEVVKQFQNGGADAKMITLNSGGHSGPDLSMGGSTSVKDITTRLGIHYDVVSIGWYLTVEDIYEKHIMVAPN